MRPSKLTLRLIAGWTVLGLAAFAQTEKQAPRPKDEQGKVYFKSPDLDHTASCLLRMNEPSLWTRQPDDHGFYLRWTWIRTFHEPVIFRIVKQPGKQAQLAVKMLDGKGGYDIGHLRLDKQLALEDRDWDKVQNWITQPDFWKPLSELEAAELTALDGASWVLEQSSHDKYEILHLSSPKTNNPPGYRSFGPQVTLGRLLTKLAKMEFADHEFY